MRNGFFVALIAAGVILLYLGCSSYQGALDVEAQPSSQTAIQGSDEEILPKPETSADDTFVQKKDIDEENISTAPVDKLPDQQADVSGFSKKDLIPPSNPYYYYAAAQLLSKTGDINHAIEYVIKSIESDPESAYLKRELAVLYLRQRNVNAALQIAEQHLKEAPDDLDMLLLYGRIKESQKNVLEAQKVYEEVIDKDPERKSVYLMLGRLYMEEQDLTNALRIYEKLVQRFPSSYVGHFFVGKIHAIQGDFKEAEKSFYKTLEIEPSLEEPRFELLEIYRIQGNKKKIEQTYQQILEKNPNNYIRAAMSLGYFYHQNKKFKKAEDIFIELGKQSLTNPDVVRKIKRLYLDSQKFSEAIVILEGMLKGAPDSSEIHFYAGIAYSGISDSEMALKHFKQVSSDTPFYMDAIAEMSFIFQKIEEYGQAIDVLKQGLDVEPDNVSLRYRLGIIYDLGGEKSLSIEEMKTVIRLDPEHASALNYLGYTYAELGENLDEAERLIKKALEFKPEDGFFTDSLGWVYYKKGLIDKAVVLLERAVDLEPNDPIILEHLGDAYLKSNDKKKALELYNRSLLERKDDESNKAELEKKIQELTGKGPQDG